MTKIINFIATLWRSMFRVESDFQFNRQPFEAPTIPVAPTIRKPRVARAKTLHRMLENIEHAFEVNVVAPKFHVTAHDFDLAGLDEDDAPEGGKGMMYMSKVGKTLSDLEQRGDRKPLPALQ